MVRGALRPYLVGICVFTVSFTLLSVIFRHPERKPNEEAWSSRQRASIVTGAVREKPAIAASAITPPKEEAPAQAAVIDEASAPPRVEPEKRVVEERRPRSTRTHTRVVRREEAKPAAKPETTNPIPEPAPVIVATPPVEAPVVHEEVTPPKVEPAPAPPPPPVIAPTKPIVTNDTPAPKTRQQVEDELRRARASGALPKFGNPNPAGPGGVPSDTKLP